MFMMRKTVGGMGKVTFLSTLSRKEREGLMTLEKISAPIVLTINAESSNIRFALFEAKKLHV